MDYTGMRPADPAETKGYLRLFYRGWRPTWLGRMWSQGFAVLSGLGLTPQTLVSLQVRDTRRGKLRSVVLVAVPINGALYIVSMLGTASQWVQDIGAAGGRAFIMRRRRQPVLITEIPQQDRAPILKAWSRIATSGRRHLPVPYDAPLAAFESIAADYPVFRIDPAEATGTPPGVSAGCRRRATDG